MSSEHFPRPYPEWRTGPADHQEDAAHTFGFHIMHHCFEETMEKSRELSLPRTPEEFQVAAATIAETALFNVMELLEGFWPLRSGTEHCVEYVLSVAVKRLDGTLVERIDISPVKVDLPIGYWLWRGGEFR
ncbi:MAG: hypothetical protein WC718_18545 [Phycisphaerales bacterium]|jgi:hypothetical protein